MPPLRGIDYRSPSRNPHPSISNSWYKNASGKIHILSPWRLVDDWAWTREPDPSTLEIV